MTHPGDFVPLDIAVLTVSDTRTEETDASGRILVDHLSTAGHRLADKRILPDDIYRIRAAVSEWIADEHVDAVLITGGTGLTRRDVTPEAVEPLLDRIIPGFGELFRAASLEAVGTSTLQSRALGGLANATLVFCIPGSTNACITAWEAVLAAQLDSRTTPCNLVQLLPRAFGSGA